MARKMKDSGIEWIGEIPENWDTGRLQWCLEEIKEKNNPIRTTHVLSLTIKLGVIPYEEKGNQGNKAKEDYSQYGLAFKDTLVINSMNVLIGSVGISKYYGCVSPVYYVYKSTDKADLRFINYVFQNTGFQKELRKYANGILEIRMRISSHDMLRRIIPFPCVSEQRHIADYLDTKCAKIDAVLEQTRNSIEEYKKLKQAVITQAVTKGIRPGRKMKDSGIEWIGEVPEEWNVVISRFVFDKVGDVDHYMPESVDNGVPYIMTGDLKPMLSGIDSNSCKKISINDYQKLSQKIKLSIGDIIFARYATIGTVCYVDANIDCVISYSCVIIKPTQEKLLGKYLYYFLQSSAFFEDVSQYINSNTQGNVGIEALYKVKIPVPPIEEQSKIVVYLDNLTEKFEELINKKQQFLTELESYKKSLIYECVTGKREV